MTMRSLVLSLLCGIWLAVAPLSATAAPPRNLAPGFSNLPRGATLVVVPPDVELFSISGGGVYEPRADWTETAGRHIHTALDRRAERLGVKMIDLSDKDADDLAEINTLHAAVARSIALHHMGTDSMALPTKGGKLDWSLGEAVQPLQQRSGADYALFVWMRDSYASAERKATMIALALLGVGIPGGFQYGYASLVDLHSGQVLWFNRLVRGSGDLRNAGDAEETVKALLDHFPESQ